MVNKLKTRYFLGANSIHGFYSAYDSMVDPTAGDKLYIIKSGPGSGKSSFMKRIAEKADSAGYSSELIFCSGDPDSLDGVYFPEKRTAIVDGTSPHVIEPDYPAICDNYVPLGQFYSEKASEVKGEVMRLFASYKACYTRAYRSLDHFASIMSPVMPEIDYEAIDKKAKLTVKKICSSLGKGGMSKNRFFSAFTCKGPVEEISELKKYDTAICLVGDGSVCSAFCKAFKDAAESMNYAVISYLDPLFPEKTVAASIPELSVLVYDKNAVSGNLDVNKSISLNSFVEKESLKRCKKLSKYLEKPGEFLLSEAEGHLRNAKSFHDELESVYNPYVDFSAVYAMSDQYFKKIFE